MERDRNFILSASSLETSRPVKVNTDVLQAGGWEVGLDGAKTGSGGPNDPLQKGQTPRTVP